MNTLWQDIRYAVRTLSKAPSFVLIIIISIALGIGANATVVSIAEGLLWGVWNNGVRNLFSGVRDSA
jgi:hypothetical protein